MVDKQHGEIVALDGPLGVDGIHVTHNYSFANESTQDTFPVLVTDIGKICRRLDIDGFFIAVTAGTGLENWKRFDNAANQVFSINQVAHGLSVLDSVRSSSGNFVQARANDPATCGIGVVSEVASVDDFVVVTGGAFRATAHGFTLDAILYTDSTTPGLLTETRPTEFTQFQNAMCLVFNADILILLGWDIEQSPTIANRLILTSPTGADLTSTAHALQLGGDGEFQFKMSPGVFQVVTAGGAGGNFRMQCNQYRMIIDSIATVESAAADLFRLRDTDSVTLAQNFALRMSYESDSGVVLHGSVGFTNADGFRSLSNKTGATNKNFSWFSQDGVYRFNSTNDDILRFEDPSTVLITDDHNQQIQWSSSNGSTIHGTTGYSGSDGYLVESFKTGATNKNANFKFAGTDAAVIAPRFIATSPDVAEVDSTGHAFQVGLDDAAHMNFSNNKLVSVDSVGAAAPFNVECSSMLFDQGAGRMVSISTNDNAIEMLNPNVIPFGQGHTQKLAFQTGGAVTHAQVGFEGNFVIRTFKTGVFLSNIGLSCFGGGTIVCDTTAADTTPIMTLTETGAGGNSVNIHVGTTSPSGRVSAPDGSVYHQASGATSNMYINRSVGTGTTWVAVI